MTDPVGLAGREYTGLSGYPKLLGSNDRYEGGGSPSKELSSGISGCFQLMCGTNVRMSIG